MSTSSKPHTSAHRIWDADRVSAPFKTHSGTQFMTHRALLLLAAAVLGTAPTMAPAQTAASRGQASPAGEALPARAGEQVTVRLEYASAFANDTAKTAVIRRRTDPTTVTIQILPTTTARDLAHALLTVAHSPAATVRLRADEVKAFLPGAPKVGTEVDQHLGLAQTLMAQLAREGHASASLPLRVVSSLRP